MHQWVRRWEITIAWERASDSPFKARRYSTRVDTAADLRALVEMARADRNVVRLEYHSVREMVGSAPDECQHGHPLSGGSVHRAKQDWINCVCGGHLVFLCKHCQDRIILPR